MLPSIFISALLMWGAIWLLSRHEGCVSLRPVLLISVAVCLLNYLALRFLGPWGLPPLLAALFLSLRRWCALSMAQSLLATVAWLLGQALSGWWFGPIY